MKGVEISGGRMGWLGRNFRASGFGVLSVCMKIVRRPLPIVPGAAADHSFWCAGCSLGRYPAVIGDDLELLEAGLRAASQSREQDTTGPGRLLRANSDADVLKSLFGAIVQTNRYRSGKG